MSTNGRNVVFLVIFDTCDVMYNWSISLLPPSVLDNLFVSTYIPTYLPAYINTYQPTYIPTYLPTYLPLTVCSIAGPYLRSLLGKMKEFIRIPRNKHTYTTHNTHIVYIIHKHTTTHTHTKHTTLT